MERETSPSARSPPMKCSAAPSEDSMLVRILDELRAVRVSQKRVEAFMTENGRAGSKRVAEPPNVSSSTCTASAGSRTGGECQERSAVTAAESGAWTPDAIDQPNSPPEASQTSATSPVHSFGSFVSSTDGLGSLHNAYSDHNGPKYLKAKLRDDYVPKKREESRTRNVPSTIVFKVSSRQIDPEDCAPSRF